jgi:hypothetical protein
MGRFTNGARQATDPLRVLTMLQQAIVGLIIAELANTFAISSVGLARAYSLMLVMVKSSTIQVV